MTRPPPKPAYSFGLHAPYSPSPPNIANLIGTTGALLIVLVCGDLHLFWGWCCVCRWPADGPSAPVLEDKVALIAG